MKTIFKEGDKVFDYAFGWGEVIKTHESEYPITVRFNNTVYSYTLEGSMLIGAKPTLSFKEYTIEGFSQERLVTFEKDEWVAVSNDNEYWSIQRYVSGKETKDFYNSKSEKKYIKKLTDFNK
jgi:hypothetical protein